MGTLPLPVPDDLLTRCRRARYIADRYWDEIRPRNLRNAFLDALDAESRQLLVLAWERMKRQESIDASARVSDLPILMLRATIQEFHSHFPLLFNFVMEWPPRPGLNYYPPEVGMVRHLLDQLEDRLVGLDRQLRLF